MQTFVSGESLLAIKLGKALRQTFEELASLKEEHFLNARFLQTLREENLLLRGRHEALEEKFLIAKEQEKRAALEEQRKKFKKAQAKVAHVLKRTLQELKKYRHLQGTEEALQIHMEELQVTARQKTALLEDLFVLQEELQAMKQQREDEMRRLKGEFQAILKKTKEETLLFVQKKLEGEKSGLQEELLLAQKKLQDLAQQTRDQAKVITSLKETLEKKEAFLKQKKEQEESLQLDLKEWQDKYYNATVRLNRSESALSEFQNLKVEYEKMHVLFSNISSFLGTSFGQNVPPSVSHLLPSIQEDLFNRQEMRQKPKDELFS